MNADNWFDDLPVIGKLPPEEAAAKLREVGEDELADAIEAAQRKVTTASTTFGILEDLLPFLPKPWLYPAHVFGYSTPAMSDSTELPIQDACNIVADSTLKNTPIKITLDRVRVAKYPGGGVHHILFDFEAQTQLLDRGKILNINAVHRIREGDGVAIINQPIFPPLYVGSESVAFRCLTVNVKNEEDEAALKFLESPTFKAGVAAASIAQPLIAPATELAIGLTRRIAKRSKNVTVQKFDMGLDFSTIPNRARLAEGSYIAVQIPENMQLAWDWDEWVYDPSSGQVVNDYDRTELIPYNYIIFSVSRYEES
jgi:hypothetical protein